MLSLLYIHAYNVVIRSPFPLSPLILPLSSRLHIPQKLNFSLGPRGAVCDGVEPPPVPVMLCDSVGPPLVPVVLCVHGVEHLLEHRQHFKQAHAPEEN